MLVVEGLGHGLLEPVGLGHVVTMMRGLDGSLGYYRLLLLERVGLGHVVTIHGHILPSITCARPATGAVVIVDQPTRAVDRKGGP
jgi:hypothetical protein